MQHAIELQTLYNDRKGLWGTPQNQDEQQHKWVKCALMQFWVCSSSPEHFARVFMQSNVKRQPGMLAIALQDIDRLLYT